MPKIPDMSKLEKKKPIEEDTSIQEIEDFLRKEFPLKNGESKVKYCRVTELNYRINFYINTTSDKFVSSNEVGRTFFVTLKKVKGRYFIHKNET